MILYFSLKLLVLFCSVEFSDPIDKIMYIWLVTVGSKILQITTRTFIYMYCNQPEHFPCERMNTTCTLKWTIQSLNQGLLSITDLIWHFCITY